MSTEPAGTLRQQGRWWADAHRSACQLAQRASSARATAQMNAVQAAQRQADDTFMHCPHLSSTYRKILSGRPVMPMWRTRPCALSASSAGSVSFTICGQRGEERG